MSRIYKILPRPGWDLALERGWLNGSAVDHLDGFIHFSMADQAQETARRHFAGQSALVVLEVEVDDLGEALSWEPSRGGDLFPHLYRPFRIDQVRSVRPAPPDADGVPVIPMTA